MLENELVPVPGFQCPGSSARALRWVCRELLPLASRRRDPEWLASAADVERLG